jgi:hypothetical protein
MPKLHGLRTVDIRLTQADRGVPAWHDLVASGLATFTSYITPMKSVPAIRSRPPIKNIGPLQPTIPQRSGNVPRLTSEQMLEIDRVMHQAGRNLGLLTNAAFFDTSRSPV